ncbi:YusW family protein [Sporosarcina luteola]|uniref:YusW family protein n=1 Tax=Sporosarcina luteola TaxID=582850 RepID=UPI00203AE3CF|nr:YusW family protein [Sporosarcina luteola]MCM3709600.1 YusW family protein [Sporosarcina luteola]
MKKIGTLSFAGALSLMLIGCGTDGQREEPTVKEETPADIKEETIKEETPADMLQNMDELDYVEFELEVEYAGDNEYEAELETKSVGTVIAKIEDELNHVRKDGTEAFDELYPLVQQLTITQKTNKDEAIAEVLKTFNLPTDYTKFDLEITFNDGTKVEFEDKKK